MKSLNSFADHAPKRDWLVSFFELKEDFFTEHTLGPMMYDMFRRFLRDAGLNEKNHFTDFITLVLCALFGYGVVADAADQLWSGRCACVFVRACVVYV